MNVFQLFAGSFHSAATYRYMRAKASFGMGYALFVVLITTFFVLCFYGLPVYTVTFMSHNDQPPLFDQAMRQIASQAPVMTLKGDTLVTKTPEKTVINVSGSYYKESYNLPIITIDTTGASTTDNTTTPILVTDKNLFIRSADKWQSQPLSDFTKNGPDTIIINHAVADDMANSFIRYIHEHLVGYFFILWLIAIACLFVVSFFILLTLGLVGMTIGSIIRSPISLPAAVGLASLSFTPVALLDAALLTFFGYAAHIITLLFAGSVTLYAAIQCSDPHTTPAVTV